RHVVCDVAGAGRRALPRRGGHRSAIAGRPPRRPLRVAADRGAARHATAPVLHQRRQSAAGPPPPATMSASRGDLPAVTAIVLTYRAREAASAAVAGLAPAHAAGLLECIVVDNASGDGSGAYLRARHPWATVVDNGENIGFGRGCNTGLDRVR